MVLERERIILCNHHDSHPASAGARVSYIYNYTSPIIIMQMVSHVLYTCTVPASDRGTLLSVSCDVDNAV